jgi:hypothetical protein
MLGCSLVFRHGGVRAWSVEAMDRLGKEAGADLTTFNELGEGEERGTATSEEGPPL